MARVGVVHLLRLWYLVEFGSDEGSLTVFGVEGVGGGGLARLGDLVQ